MHKDFHYNNILIFSQKGLTPLHLCIIGNHIECIRKLLTSNVNIHIPTHCGSLAIHFAANLGNTDIFDLLISKQSIPLDLTETDRQGNVC
jgi:ankyrin repeat protein